LGEQRAILQLLQGQRRSGESKRHACPNILNRSGFRENPKREQGILGSFSEFDCTNHHTAVYTTNKFKMARRGGKLWGTTLFLVLAGCMSVRAETPIDQAFNRLYNFDFQGSNQILERQIQREPFDPLPSSVNAATHLFSELYRLKILEVDFFVDDNKVVNRKALIPDPAVRQAFFRSVEDAEGLASARLASWPDDPNEIGRASCR